MHIHGYACISIDMHIAGGHVYRVIASDLAIRWNFLLTSWENIFFELVGSSTLDFGSDLLTPKLEFGKNPVAEHRGIPAGTFFSQNNTSLQFWTSFM